MTGVSGSGNGRSGSVDDGRPGRRARHGAAGSRRPTRYRRAVLAVVVTTAVVLAGCGLESRRGVELGHLRDLARRVEGGGAGCPLSIPRGLLRPATVEADTPIVPLRDDGPGSVGTIGDGLPTPESVRIVCRHQIGGLAVTLDVVGVTEGHAIAVLADRLADRGDGATVLTFIDVNGELPVGRARGLPGTPPAAFARVAAATGDIAIVLDVDRLDEGVRLPSVAQVEQDAVTIAAALAD